MSRRTAQQSLASHIRHWAGRTSPPAIVVPGRPPVSYGDMAAAVRERVGALDGAATGDVIGIALADPVEFVAWTVAASESGRSAFLVQPDLTDLELWALASSEGAAALIVAEDRFGAGRRIGSSSLHSRVGAGAGGGSSLHFYTSGTDGRPKGAIKDTTRLMDEGRTVAAVLGYRPGTRVMAAVPLCHAYGFALGVLGVLSAGGTLVGARPRTGTAFTRCVVEHDVDVVVGVPALYDLWAGRGSMGSLASGMTRCVSAGAPLPTDVADRFERLSGVRPTVLYGTTECGVISVAADGQTAPSDVGFPCPGVDVRAGSPDQPAEIVVRTPYAAQGYVNGAERDLKRTPFTADGVRVGDAGWLDGTGRLHLTGRRTDLVNVHGRKVGPAEVEDVVRAHRLVVDAAVVGVAMGSDEWLAAFVVTRAAINEQQLFEHCRERLARFKVPRRFYVVDEIPRTSTGKPRRDVLRQRVAGDR
jgi:long-chain acyl-CoA synthetase